MGNRRIASKYRVRPLSAVMIGKAAARAMTAPSICCPRITRQATYADTPRVDGVDLGCDHDSDRE